MEYFVNGVRLKYDVTGSRSWGSDIVLLDQAIDLSVRTGWHDRGFTIESLFTPEHYSLFIEQCHALLIRLWSEAGLNLRHDFQPDRYHTVVTDLAAHLRAVEKTKLLGVGKFPILVKEIEQRVSEICNVPLVARNPFDNQAVFHFRVIRPMQADNNPLHRDVWLEDYDDCINIYIPIAGSNEQSSLILLPGSHLWPESRIEKTNAGAEINGIKFNVPAVTEIRGSYVAERPDPKVNQILVFSPYLIHGGAVNSNKDLTRISIEMRLWRR